MLNTIENYLREQTTAEHLALLIQCDVVLHDFGVQDFDLQLLDLMEQAIGGLAEHDATVWAIDAQYRTLLQYVLQEHYIILEDEDLPLPELTIIVQALKTCQHLDSPQLVLDVIDSDDDETAKLAFIFSMCTIYSPEWFLVRIAQCHPNTLPMLREHYEPAASMERFVDYEQLQSSEFFIQRLRDLLGCLQVPELNITRLASAGMGMGLAYQDYVQTLDLYLQQLSERNIVAELFGAALISSDQSSVIELITPTFQTYALDTDQAARMRRAANALDTAFASFVAQREQAQP